VYQLTASFPKQEVYGAISQTRRAAVSIASNIAEGFKRRSRPEKAHFLNIAQGSLEESRYYLILAQDLKWIDTLKVRDQLDELSRLLENYRIAIQRSIH
jgi:four helix bundle protein